MICLHTGIFVKFSEIERIYDSSVNTEIKKDVMVEKLSSNDKSRLYLKLYNDDTLYPIKFKLNEHVFAHDDDIYIVSEDSIDYVWSIIDKWNKS